MADFDHLRIENDPRYRELVSARGRFTRRATAATLLAYFGFILLVAFARPLLATPLYGGTTTIGILLGVGMIVFAIVLTGLYVRRASSSFDPLVRELTADYDR